MGKRRRTHYVSPPKGLASAKNKNGAKNPPPPVPKPSSFTPDGSSGPNVENPTEQPEPSQGWSKPPGLSDKFDLLMRKGPGGLTIAQLNVKKIGRAKRKELAAILSMLKVDCLAIVEHHVEAGDYKVDKGAVPFLADKDRF